MRFLRTICLSLSLSVVLAHSIFPHHHFDLEELFHSAFVSAHHAHHHHDDADHDDEQHSIFTILQIENTFLTGKQIIVPITIPPFIETFQWSFVAHDDLASNKFYINDIEIPPLIRCQEISFRGPPFS